MRRRLFVAPPGRHWFRCAGPEPSIQVWLYGLFVTFLHVGYLAAFVYRWLLLKDQIPEPRVREERPRGLLGRR